MEIQKIFKKNGYKLYIVGGAVRDAMLGKIPKDFEKNLLFF
jgi:tRNA nucleotidyltransferase/poly(A) polymerase